MAAQEPDVIVPPPGIAYGMPKKFISATYSRFPSVAGPHSIPPRVEPGPGALLQRILPVVASSAQYWPLFCPAPTAETTVFRFLIVNRFGPEPKSKSGPG